MKNEIVEYTSADIANQVDRLKAVPWNSAKHNSHIITVGPWTPEALGIVREERLREAYVKYQEKLSKRPLWTPEDIFRPDELISSRKMLSRRSQVGLGVIADTEGEIDAYLRAGEIVFTSSAILDTHYGWVKEERRHDDTTNMAREIIFGENSPEIQDIVAQINEGKKDVVDKFLDLIKRRRKPRWNHEQHAGLTTEIGHGLYLPEQEDLTAEADERADELAYQDYLKYGITDRDFGVCRIYRAIRPEEVRHSGMGINRSKIDFSLAPVTTAELFLIVRDGFEMPGQDFINYSRRLSVILYGSREAYLNRVEESFNKTSRLVFGVDNPADVIRLGVNIIELNRSLKNPELRVVQKDASLEEYREATGSI